MNAFATWPGFSGALPAVSLGLVVIVKWTVVLTLAWVAHGLLARRNPRWRVALWRTAVVGLTLMAMRSVVRPLVSYRLGPRDQPLRKAVPTVAVRGAAEVDTLRAQTGVPGERRAAGADFGHPWSDFPARVAGDVAGTLPEVPVMVGRNEPATRKAQGFR
jgi:hypothetical protein